MIYSVSHNRIAPSLTRWMGVGLVWFMGLASRYPAQQANGDELAALRADYERNVHSAVRSLDERYRLELRQIERQRADSGDYEGAAQVKKRLEALAQATAATAIVARPASYVLDAARAALREGALLDSSRGVIEFRRTGSKATWEMLSLEPGVYEVKATYSVGLPDFSPRARDSADISTATSGPPIAGGVMGFGELSVGSTSFLTSQLQKRISTTGSWNNFVTETLGRYEFKARSATLRLEALSASSSGLMHLKQIELVRVSRGNEEAASSEASPLANNSALNVPLALENLRDRQRAAVRAAMSRVRLRFAGELDRLERDLLSRGESAAAARVVQERTSLFRYDDSSAATETRDSVPLLPVR